MRITAEVTSRVAAAILSLDTDKVRDAYRRGEFPRADKVKDLDKRYRWDMFYAARGWAIVADLDVNDAHIDTMLRAIVSPL